MTSVHDIAATEAFCRERGIDPHRLRRFRNAFYKKHRGPEAVGEFEPADAEAFERAFALTELEPVSEHASSMDGATKLIFKTDSGYLVESVVLRPSTGRSALCVSSQVGCAAGCAFCATGQMGVARNLSAGQILDQAVQANRRLADEGRSVRNVVFMGMGEPLHNEAALYEALEVLQSPACFDLTGRRVLVSTVGVPDAMERLAEAFPRVNLALSLHAARQEVRETIIPIATRHRLDDLRATLDRIAGPGAPRRVMIEYLMLDGVNDSDDDRLALERFLAGLNTHVNLIPYNPIDNAPELVGSPREKIRDFAAGLKATGHRVTVRYSLGADIAAACGQLVRHENRQIARVNLLGE
ncbi:MAG: 23S rRNA (adenine(2503)-C(2))-methyltransferase RlmN [Planctomycetota bacterium]|jgi:23S rRNA (adenine2503-C2)-methyltransferase